MSDSSNPGGLMSRIFTRLGVADKNGAATKGTNRAAKEQQLDEYIVSCPSPQNAIDSLPGWNQALPPHLGVKAGIHHFYADPRILWAMAQFGNLAGARVLEIGPLEASHTYMLEQQGPAVLHAVEANKLSFLRCLVVKELLEMKIARFFLGDCQLWLENNDWRYDLIVASGVLYHMQDPIRFLEAMANRSDAIFLWTHYADDRAMPPNDARRGAFVGEPEVRDFRGVKVRLHRRSYLGAWKDKAFCGGMHDLHRWVERDDILKILGAMGFDDVRTWGDEPQHAFGPAFCVFARRSRPIAEVAAPAAAAVSPVQT